jgi:hypothetical protein
LLLDSIRRGCHYYPSISSVQVLSPDNPHPSLGIPMLE